MVLVFALFSAAAQADTFVWQNPDKTFTMSFPDSWLIQTPDTPTTQLRIAGPLGEDRATCRMQVEADGRLKIYPKRLVDEAVVETLNKDFWYAQAGEFKDAEITAYYAPASMGDKGDATAIQVSFRQPDGSGEMVPMHGVMLSSIYGGDRYTAACFSKADVFKRWSGVFMSVLDSVQLEQKYHPFATGYYRNFLADPKLYLPRSKPGTIRPPQSTFSFFNR
jgi:hypothetical protein